MSGFFYEMASGLFDSLDSTKRDIGMFLNCISICCIVSAFMFLYFAMRSMWKVAKSSILKTSIHTFIIFLFPVSVAVFSRMTGHAHRNEISEIINIIVIVGGLIYCFILLYRIYKEVAYITNQPLFMAVFWLSIASGVLSVLAQKTSYSAVAIALDLIILIIYIVAWIKVKDIRESTSAEKYK